MHRCLQTTDTLLLILQYFRCPDTLPLLQNISALAALARTCHTLSGPALDLLWENQWTLVNLVQCLPADAWNVDVEEPMDADNNGPTQNQAVGTVSVIRPLFGTDWERFDFYAARIKLLRLSVPYVKVGVKLVLQPTTLATLSAFHLPAPLLPHVQTLHLYSSESESAGIAHVLTGPSLRGLAVTWPADNPSTPALISHVIRVSPHLTSLSFGQTVAPYEPGSFNALRNLQHVEISMPEQREHASDMLTWLAGLPHLQTLLLYRVSFCLCKLAESSNINTVQAFAELHSLGLTTDSIPTANTSLPLFAPHRLSALSVSEAPKAQASPLRSVDDFLQSVLTLCDPNRLDQLAFNFRTHTIPDSGPLRLSDFRGLLVFRKMQNFTFVTPIPLALTNEDVAEIAMAWPSLLVLRLGNRPAEAIVEPKPTPAVTLAILAIHCPRLRELELTFNAMISPGPNSIVPLAHPSSGHLLINLIHLDVGASPINSPLTIALLITDICPNLAIITHYPHAGPAICLWSEVSRMTAILKPARMQERFRMHMANLRRRAEIESK
ncbi:hypothetical protein CERSUDRAFT_94840 [Gelatoporia subvermispora B]|uniref:F-box domain-containing protein n=1 Tax=Ceriporiopsis subvermispora (strain B) TaxID=914234 RepID=M2PN42_CERS8|nr:hypothetical protein CERSUDRAFT_94840 [Gelatoporia subvermispora B]